MNAPGPVLGVETSCDETAAAVISPDGGILSNIIYSQQVHVAYGGVVPELASREHAGRLPGVVSKALMEAGLTWDKLSGIAVTAGPGLVGCLLVGVAFARAAARARGLPVIAVNHLEGHAHTPAMTDPSLAYPHLVLIASGGHTSLVSVEKRGAFRLLGQTRDDAAGEALDKVGKWIGFDYPAGPALDRAGFEGNPEAVAFPRATFEGQGYDFSFSGVKTAALTDWEARLNGSLPKVELCDWIASFETAVMDALCVQLFRGAEETNVSVVGLAGGVACNRRLRRMVGQWAQRTGRRAILPEASLCADNAAMIAAVGLYHWQPANVCRYDFDAIPNWGLGTPLPD